MMPMRGIFVGRGCARAALGIAAAPAMSAINSRRFIGSALAQAGQ
jgi:hypothetical protein